MITYNHQRFISKAIESVLAQKFYHNIQIVIGVDKSEDETLSICQSYHNRFPEIIELLVHDKNVGMFENFVSVLKKCTGKYIAILEGDDYWNNENKLQEQFLFFQKHHNCILSSGTIVEIDEQDNFLSKPVSSARDEIIEREDLIIINRLATLTVAFRKEALQMDQLELLRTAPHLDWGLYLSLKFSSNSFAYKFGKIYGAYRKHAGGVYSSIDSDKRNQNILKTIIALYNLRIGEGYKSYLRCLYSNYTLKLSDKSILKSYQQQLYNEELIIYTNRDTLKWTYIKSLYKNAFLFLVRRADYKALKLHWALLRQTRLRKKNYLNIFIILISPVIALMLAKDHRLKKKLLKIQL